LHFLSRLPAAACAFGVHRAGQSLAGGPVYIDSGEEPFKRHAQDLPNRLKALIVHTLSDGPTAPAAEVVAPLRTIVTAF
jgi:hypothetical protein